MTEYKVGKPDGTYYNRKKCEFCDEYAIQELWYKVLGVKFVQTIWVCKTHLFQLQSTPNRLEDEKSV